MARVLTIANQKGGVGKTTTAVNLSASLAVAEKRTLLIDMDPQSNATSGLGRTLAESEKTIYHVLIEKFSIKEIIFDTALPYLKLIPSNQQLIGAEIELINIISRETQLKRAISEVASDFDYIIIDCPPSLGLLTLNALAAADSVIIPLQCEYYALEGLSHLIKTINIIKERLNPELKVEGVLLTMFDQRNNLSHQIESDVRKNLRDSVFQSIIPRNIKLSEAPSFGKPIILYDVRSKGCASYLNFAKEIISKAG